MPTKRLVYYDPSGETHEDVDVDALVTQLRKGGKSYWNGGWGGGVLYHGRYQGRLQLHIHFVPRRGFHVVHRDGPKRELAAMADRPPKTAKWTNVYVCGDPVPVSTAQLVSPEAAETAVRHFAAEGTPSPALTWEPKRPSTKGNKASETAALVKALIAKHLKIEPGKVTDRARFEALGATREDVGGLLVAVELDLGIELADEADVETVKKVSDLIAFVQESRP